MWRMEVNAEVSSDWHAEGLWPFRSYAYFLNSHIRIFSEITRSRKSRLLKKRRVVEQPGPSKVVRLTRLDLYWAGLASCERDVQSSRLATGSRRVCPEKGALVMAKAMAKFRVGGRVPVLRKQAGKRKGRLGGRCTIRVKSSYSSERFVFSYLLRLTYE